jgi:putative aminopeptidase FrvX
MNNNGKSSSIDIKLLENLTVTPGVSGREEEIGALIRKEMMPYVDSITTDILGNIICRKDGDRPSVLVEAHMDEVGFMVSGVEDSGFVRFLPIGPVLEPLLVGQRLSFIPIREHSRGWLDMVRIVVMVLVMRICILIPD